MDTYTISVLNAINKLEQCKEDLIDAMLDVALKGKLKEWDETMDEGDEVFFIRELFLSLDDQNITQLIKIIDALEMKFPTNSII